jgi:hypothetical protein
VSWSLRERGLPPFSGALNEPLDRPRVRRQPPREPLRLGPNTPPSPPLAAFLAAPPEAQETFWLRLADWATSEGDVERYLDELECDDPVPPELPERRAERLGRSVRSRMPRCAPRSRVSRTGQSSQRREDDVLDEIAPPDYWEALTGEPVPESQRVRCPIAGHEDVHPSCIVYANPGRGWWCPVCNRGGTAIDLAAHLTGIEPRGADYFELRRYVAKQLLGVAS